MTKQNIDFTRRDYWDQDSLLLYKEAVSRYPYCAPARLSFLLNLKVLNDPDFEEELAFTALSVPDRQRLQEEVQAVEEAATVWRERGERRMRQAARWTSAPVIQQTTVPVGRLMNVNAPATASNAAAGIEAAGVEAHGQEVDFRAVAANDPANRFGHAVMASEAARANDTATPTDDTWGEDWPARSRSSRRNARRWARLEERRREALEAKSAAMAVAAAEAEAKAKAEREAAAREAAAQVLVSEAKPKRRTKSSSSTISMLLANEVKSASKQPSRRRGGVFNPWAEVFTAKYTISDWLQEDETPASKSAQKSSKTARSGAKTKTTSGKSKSSAAKTKSASAKTKAEPKSKTTAKSSSAKASARSAAPSSAYIDPNELIDRFLSNNSDRDLAIHPDDSRDYEAFNPDRGSLNEDWSMGSETLAQIYLKQGAPDKAIEIYRSLSLKFPEKNRYFAGLIREAEETKTKK